MKIKKFKLFKESRDEVNIMYDEINADVYREDEILPITSYEYQKIIEFCENHNVYIHKRDNSEIELKFHPNNQFGSVDCLFFKNDDNYFIFAQDISRIPSYYRCDDLDGLFDLMLDLI